MIVILNDGAPLLLYQNYGLDTGFSTGMSLHCYDNDFTPLPDSNPSAFIEASFTGYSPETLDPGLWSSVVMYLDHPFMVYNAPTYIVFTNTGVTSATLYGYFVKNDDIGNYLFAERFDSPRTLAPGQSFTLILSITGGNCSLPPPPPPPP